MIPITTSFWSKSRGNLPLSSIIHHRRRKTSDVIFKRDATIKLNRMSEKAFTKSFNSLQSVIGVKIKLNIKELAVQFGRGRVIKSEQNILSLLSIWHLFDWTILKYPHSGSSSKPRVSNIYFWVLHHLKPLEHIIKSSRYYMCSNSRVLHINQLRILQFYLVRDQRNLRVSF